MRTDNLYPKVRGRPPQMLLAFKYEPTPEELAWVMKMLPEGIRHANAMQETFEEYDEVVYTWEGQLESLGVKMAWKP